MPLRALLICDDADLNAEIAGCVQSLGGEVVTEPLLAHVVVADGAADEVEARVAAAASHRRVEVLGLLDTESDVELLTATDTVRKPVARDELRQRIDRLYRRHRENRTRREALLAIAVEAAGDVVEITDARHVLEYVNTAFEHTLGYPASDVVGRPAGRIMRSQLQDDAFYEAMHAELDEGRSWSGLILAKARDGRVVQFESTISPVLSDEGQVLHHVAVKRDVTDRVAAEAELRALNEALSQARDAAVEASRVKSQFLANMSHELRTPLNAIIGYAELLIEIVEDAGAEEGREDLEKIIRSAHHLLRLVNDVLDLSKIEAGQMSICVETTNLRTIVDDAVATVQPVAFERGNEFVVRYQLDYDDVETDPTKLRQMLLNLLSNANKFTERGPVLVQVVPDPRPDGDPETFFAVKVSDTGIGMTEEEIARVFDPFVQADGSTTRRYGGTGLGLALNQRFCRLMDGEMSVESARGQGSTFTLRLPRRLNRPDRT